MMQCTRCGYGPLEQLPHDKCLRAKADELQAQGPDEFPRGYYEHLAKEALS